MGQVEKWNALANQLSVDSIRATTAAGSGHPTTCLSAAHLVAVLFGGHLRNDFGDPSNPGNDRFVLSKGHAAPLLYAALKAAGAISDDELMSLRQLGSRLEGHPVPVLPWVQVATGSLGQGLSIGTGMALAARLDGHSPRIWVLLGDSEMAEGSVWEALAAAAHYRISNLVGILDVNRLGQRGETMYGHDPAAYQKRIEAFGWKTITVDGHDPASIDSAYDEAARGDGRPTMVIARTLKGKGVPEVEDRDGWHGKPLPAEVAERAVAALGGDQGLTFDVAPAEPSGGGAAGRAPGPGAGYVRPSYAEPVPTRQAYGDTLRALGVVRDDIVVLDAEVSNSTFSNIFQDAFPERFFEMFIAEQQMVGAAVGMAAMGKTAFASSFAAFLTRAYDQIRMASVSRSSIRLCGSHAGVSIGEDGPSQMALEDLAMMRAVHGATVLCPADGPSAVRLVEAMADVEGIAYMRTARNATPVIYSPDEEFAIGGSKVLRRSDSDEVAIVACGVTVVEALAAADELAASGVGARVIDAYSVKPLDAEGIRSAVGGLRAVVTVEDHHPEGGLGEAVASALAAIEGSPPLTILGVRVMPGSAKPDELREQAGISASKIAAAAQRAVAR